MTEYLVQIANPANGKSYTSQKRALKHIRRGQACFLPDGRLYFYTPSQLVELREREIIDTAIGLCRGGIVFWNGSDRDPLALHRPGEVVS
jgi:hypothetical protein